MAFSKKKWVLLPISILLFLGIIFWAIGKIQYRSNVMDVEEYSPISTLKVPEHKLTRAKFPFIDVHNHQFSMPTIDLGKLIEEMDKMNMKVMVNLSGQSGDPIKKSVANIKANYPKRFIVFANIDCIDEEFQKKLDGMSEADK